MDVISSLDIFFISTRRKKTLKLSTEMFSFNFIELRNNFSSRVIFETKAESTSKVHSLQFFLNTLVYLPDRSQSYVDFL